MLVNLGITGVAILIFLFIFWKRLKEDYASEIIFKAGFYIIAGILAGGVGALKFFDGWFFWTALAGGVAGLALAAATLRVRTYETLEAFVISAMPWLSLVFLKDSVERSSLSSFLAFLGILFLTFVFYYLDVHYKNFAWYKSGKIGFTGLTTLATIFLIRAVLAIFKINVLSFVDKYEAVMSAVAAFICFLLVFNLGRSEK